MVETPAPYRVGPSGDTKCLLVALGDNDETADPDLRHPVAVSSDLAPDFAISIREATGLMGRVQADNTEALVSRPFRTLDGVDAIPHWRMRFLQRFKLHRNIIEGEKLTLEIESPFGEALEDQVERLCIDPLCLGGIRSGALALRRPGAAADFAVAPA